MELTPTLAEAQDAIKNNKKYKNNGGIINDRS